MIEARTVYLAMRILTLLANQLRLNPLVGVVLKVPELRVHKILSIKFEHFEIHDTGRHVRPVAGQGYMLR